MKLDMMITKSGAIIPPAAFKTSGFGAHEGAECHAINDCVVVLKKCMSAPELVRAAWALRMVENSLSRGAEIYK